LAKLAREVIPHDTAAYQGNRRRRLAEFSGFAGFDGGS
jgi:hypothetical protein